MLDKLTVEINVNSSLGSTHPKLESEDRWVPNLLLLNNVKAITPCCNLVIEDTLQLFPI